MCNSTVMCEGHMTMVHDSVLAVTWNKASPGCLTENLGGVLFRFSSAPVSSILLARIF